MSIIDPDDNYNLKVLTSMNGSRVKLQSKIARLHCISSCVGQVVSTLAFGADNPGSIPGGGTEKEKFISLLLSSASEGTVSRRSSRPRASVARVSCN